METLWLMRPVTFYCLAFFFVTGGEGAMWLTLRIAGKIVTQDKGRRY